MCAALTSTDRCRLRAPFANIQEPLKPTAPATAARSPVLHPKPLSDAQVDVYLQRGNSCGGDRSSTTRARSEQAPRGETPSSCAT